jgi:hypothetical protein
MTDTHACRAGWLAKAGLGALAMGLAHPALAQTAQDVPTTEQAIASDP